jgi:nucleoside-diphosphate-sugar epimerase
MSRAERDLRHDPKINIEEGIARYVGWMRDHYRIPEPVPTERVQR